MEKWKQLLEDAIAGKLLSTLLNAGYQVDIEFQGGYVWFYAFDTEKRPSQYKYWVKCVEGNYADFITDYTTNLEETLKPVNEFVKSWMD